MSEVFQNSLSPIQTSERVLKALKEARSQLEAIEQDRSEQIAIIGMSGRFPGADNLEEFWNLLEQGKSGIKMLSDEELLAAGVPASIFNQPNYVRAYASFPDPTGFDAQFFGYAPREAELIDPQHRVFLECAWSALEDAGYDSQQYDGSIGVYGGAALNSYIVNLHSNPEIRDAISPVQAVISNVMGLMPTRVSYQLDLKGPSCGIQTGCSTALVAIHTACQSLLKKECDMALAGGVTISSAKPQGYPYQAESIAAPDGVCRAFDASGEGTVFGNGVGVVVLKRLRAALLDGDHIYAVIKGSAVNNDGADKVNLIAPSVSGQAAVIREAIAQANINPNTISYVEGHGTGTPLGDPIEVAALNKAFKTKLSHSVSTSAEVPFCALGSVKTNIGHLDAAAGAAGLIKTVLALKHRTIPASLNYERANPKIDFQNGPFFVNKQRADWPQKDTPRRAGVSSFGMGGTNAHAILEEAPKISPKAAPNNARPWQLITLSAKTSDALGKLAQNLAKHLQKQEHSARSLADIAYTLQVGRRSFAHRRFYVCESVENAVAQLRKSDGELGAIAPSTEKSVVFMFSGQGSQHIDMAKGLYETEPTFKRAIDQCAEILTGQGIDLLEVLYSESDKLGQTAYAQPALFAVEYAIAQLWISWGIQPQAVIGHSIGEYVAACIAEIFSLKDALTLVVQRGQLMQRCEPGAMLSILASADSLDLPTGAEVAVVNSPQNCVVSGPTAVIETVQQQLAAHNTPCRLLNTSHAFHSAMMDDALADFAEVLKTVTLSIPNTDIISNVTGGWLKDSEATDPNYWVRQLRATVQFSKGITQLLQLPNLVLLEVGPGHTLTRLAQQNLPPDYSVPVIQSLPHPQDTESDPATMMAALGKLWMSGVSINWTKRYQNDEIKPHRVSLPTYPFERKSYWVPLRSVETETEQRDHTAKVKAADVEDWFYLPSWKRLPLIAQVSDISNERWLVLADETLKSQLQQDLSTLDSSPEIIWVVPGSEFSDRNQNSTAEKSYQIQPHVASEYQQLTESLANNNQWPTQLVYGWSAMSTATSTSKLDDFQALVYFIQALASAERAMTISIVATDICEVTSSDTIDPHRAKILGLSQVIAQEYPGLCCRSIDIGLSTDAPDSRAIASLRKELASPYNLNQRQVAYRDYQRWIQVYEPLPLPEQSSSHLKQGSTYLIAGDLIEGLGMLYAQALIKEYDAKLILLGREGLPAPEEWEKWLLTHGPQHSISRLIRQLQALGQAGQQFLWLSGSLANADWVQASVQQGIEKFGDIKGVFHAGVMGDRASCMISQLTEDEGDRISHTKIKGVQNLQQTLHDHPVDFYLLQSSLSVIVGGAGFGTYAAANAYLDSFAAQQNNLQSSQQNTASHRWLSLNWDACQLEENAQSETTSELMALALSREEVWQTTQRALAQIDTLSGISQLVISPRSLAPRLTEAFTQRDIDPHIQPSVHPTDNDQATALPNHHTRPNLTTPYVPPQTPIEKKVTAAIGDLLGIEAVGIDDNFFELGGHSLLAIQAVTKLRQDFPVELPMRAFLFEAPTAKGIAKIIEDQVNANESESLSAETQSTLESLLDQIEDMTPEEIKNEI